MSTIYFHIPFCKQACQYCDFHFSTQLRQKEEMLRVMRRELLNRKQYLSEKKISSVYFGGGTPSLLHAGEIMELLDLVQKEFTLDTDAEITLEANPDDLSGTKITELKQTSINRLSIGIQSFFDEDLKYMHRSHNVSQAEASVKRAQDAGFENLTLDLIYGFPLLSDEKWRKNMQKTAELGVPHLSCYSMTVEPGTAMDKLVRKGRKPPMNEEQSARQFEQLMDFADTAGFIHYEISNFGKEGYFSAHNTAYWSGVHYLGIGPSAHSFDGNSRRWNIADNMKYIHSEGQEYGEEMLTEKDQRNEYILTRLRTRDGVDESAVGHLPEKVENLIVTGRMVRKGNRLTLTRRGLLIADRIASDFFV
ncbi:MAG: radical SAM family heme chaperone HemW [Bacteroidia bacterium]|nr:radical SAM family heme chaperone HemW [Bacteroidia bacterium]